MSNGIEEGKMSEERSREGEECVQGRKKIGGKEVMKSDEEDEIGCGERSIEEEEERGV